MVATQDLPTDPEFARKVEQAEIEAWLDLDTSQEGARHLRFESVEGTILLLDSSLAWPRSRILNLGIVKPATPEILASLLDLTREAGVDTLVTEVSPIARPGTIARMLTQEGFRPTERSVIVARHTKGMPEPANFFRIRQATSDDRDGVLEVMQAVMPEAPDWCVTLAGQVGRARWRHYIAVEDGAVCGVAGIHLHENMAWLAPIWTKAEYRNRGTQAALIAYAVRDAEAQGVEWVTSSYPASIPGRTRNFERLHFSIVYLRNNFIWEAEGS